MRILWYRPSKDENISVGRHRIAENLRERGHEVDVKETSCESLRDVLYEDPDVLIGTTRLGAFVGVWAKLITGTPMVIDHIVPIEQFKRNNGRFLTWAVSLAEKISFSYADHVIVVYEEEVSRVAKYANSITETNLGVDYEAFAEPSEKSVTEARKILSEHVAPEDKILLYVGGLEPIYQLPIIFEAMDELEDWQFVVLGNGSQREFVEETTNQRDNVHYLGTVPHEMIPGFMHHADVGISMVDDRNSLKMLEYGASNLSVVHVEGDAEKRFQGMVEFCEPETLDVARAVREAYETGPSEKLKQLTQKHSWNEIATQYEEAIERVR